MASAPLLVGALLAIAGLPLGQLLRRRGARLVPRDIHYAVPDTEPEPARTRRPG